jgi:CheY-like chemotaxis protein
MIKSVLIADDDPVIRATLLTYLGARGLRVIVAQDSMQASMASLRAPFPDIVLLDIKMPGGGGMQVLKRIRSSSKTSLNEFMAKPIDLEKLYLKICELINIPPVPLPEKK